MNNPRPLLFDKYNHFLSCFKIYKSSLGLTINAVDIPIHIFGGTILIFLNRYFNFDFEVKKNDQTN